MIGLLLCSSTVAAPLELGPRPKDDPVEELQWEELPDPEEEAAANEAPEPEPEPEPLDDTEAAPPAPVRNAASEQPIADPPPDEEVPAEAVAPPEPPPASDPELDLQPPAPEPRRTPRRRPKPTFPKTWYELSVVTGQSTFGLGLGATHFVLPFLGLGGEVQDLLNWGSGFVFNIFQLTPKVTVLVLPHSRVTPVARVGFGGEFISHRLGSYGRWMTGAGVLWRIRTRFMLELGVDVDGRVPDDRFARNFRCPLLDDPCSLQVAPYASFGVGF